MKKITIIAIIFLLTLCASFAFATPKEDNLGPCVRDCVRAFNQNLTDSGAEQSLAQHDFNAVVCVDYCKNEITKEDPCLYTEDDCCNNHFYFDPDCNSSVSSSSLPGAGSGCDPAVGCQEGLSCVSSTNAFGGVSYTCN